MEGLTIEQKAKAYDEAIKRVENINTGKCKTTFMFTIGLFEYIFPELAECEDEKIRKKIIKLVKEHSVNHERCQMETWLERQGNANKEYWRGYRKGKKEILDKYTELEKQSEQKHTEVKPKFKIGDWVIDEQNIVHQIANVIENVTYYTYGYDIVGDGYFNDNTEGVRLWTIQDAKDGDVLCDYCEEFDNPLIFILKKFERVDFGLVKPSDYSSYCFLTAGDRQIFKEGKYHHEHNIKPATKEQRDLLFQKMKEAGYEWNDEKKELKKIEQKPILDAEIPFGTDSELIEEAITIPDGCYAIIEDNKVILRKGEKKSSWREEDESMLNFVKVVLNKHKNDEFFDEFKTTFSDCLSWFRDIKSRVQPQLKQEWSEEDKMQLDAAIHLVSNTGHIETANWLKSIKNRVLQQNITVTDEELAKAKKDAYNDALDKIEYHSDEPTFDDGWSAAIWYLKKKNARPQSSWKPSDKQIMALRWVLNHIPYNSHKEEINGLLEQYLKGYKNN